MSKYAIWNKTDDVITPIGEVLTPEQWIERYPMAERLDIVVGGGAINGAFCMEYTSFKEIFEKQGVDFSKCKDKQECLDLIEAYEDAMNNQAPAVSDQTRIADALEDLVVLQMPDAEE